MHTVCIQLTPLPQCLCIANSSMSWTQIQTHDWGTLNKKSGETMVWNGI